jgi:hypothetical protein
MWVWVGLEMSKQGGAAVSDAKSSATKIQSGSSWVAAEALGTHNACFFYLSTETNAQSEFHWNCKHMDLTFQFSFHSLLK